MSKELAFTSAWEMRDLIKKKKVSPVEITKIYFERINRLDPQLNSYLTLNEKEALESASKAEKAVLSGEALGKLHGIPIGVKDLEMTEGIRTTQGSLIYKDNIPTADTIVVERLRKAGAIILGKTNASEFGAVGFNENRLGDHCRNPWNTERTTGASSGGAGAAMAAGLCSLATGGDGGGSIRIPSSYCGLYGLKNTQGRVPKYSGTPAQHIPNYLSQQGPMSRSVRDSAMMLEVLAGHDPRDPASLRGTIPDYMGSLNKDIKGLRLGWSSDFGYINSEPEVLEITSKAAKIFQDLGCSLDESKLNLEDPFFSWWAIYKSVIKFNISQLEENKEKLTWYMQYVLESSRDVTTDELVKALGERDIMISKFEDEFEKFDLLLSPTMPSTAFPVDTPPKSIAGKEVYPSPETMSYIYGSHPFTYPINVIGYPAATVPCGFSKDGMPIGLHIIGKKGADALVMAASSAFEKAKPWTQYIPPVS